jgi:glycosidase
MTYLCSPGETSRAAPMRYPSLYQINTRVWLTEKAAILGRRATLDDISDADLDDLAGKGFDWIWLLSVWQTGAMGRAVSRSHPDWRRGFEKTLPDLREEDIAGSGFAITAYRVADSLGGDDALARLRRRMHDRGLKLMLDFVPNHVALDHPWLNDHPDYLIEGSEEKLAREPGNYIRLKTKKGERIFAHGRDPYFAGWPDTLQLNFGNPLLQGAQTQELLSIARRADGVRCDMVMLLLPEVFERTWGIRPAPFWADAIARVKKENPDFLLLAEVYWDLEWVLQQQGFDYTYDKRLYDRLRSAAAAPVRDHLRAPLDFQKRSARFLENHDEPRAAAVFPADQHEAAAVITYFAPGLRFFQQGQFEGRRVHVSPHLVRAPVENPDPGLHGFYQKLREALSRPLCRDGAAWQLLHCVAAWPGNPTHEGFVAFAWNGGARHIACVNYAPHQAQCYARVPWSDMQGRSYVLRDMLSPAAYERDGNDLLQRGLYLDLPAWGYHVFRVQQAAEVFSFAD